MGAPGPVREQVQCHVAGRVAGTTSGYHLIEVTIPG